MNKKDKWIDKSLLDEIADFADEWFSQRNVEMLIQSQF